MRTSNELTRPVKPNMGRPASSDWATAVHNHLSIQALCRRCTVWNIQTYLVAAI